MVGVIIRVPQCETAKFYTLNRHFALSSAFQFQNLALSLQLSASAFSSHSLIFQNLLFEGHPTDRPESELQKLWARQHLVRLPKPWNYLLSVNIYFKKSFKVTQSPRAKTIRWEIQQSNTEILSSFIRILVLGHILKSIGH